MDGTDTRPKKDPAITELLERLRERLGPGAFAIVDHWEADPCAVGIARPRDTGVLAYLSTFNLPAGRYDVELELPPGPAQDLIYREAGKHWDVDFETLAEVVRRHLIVAPGSP
jgi:hypothetical protein